LKKPKRERKKEGKERTDIILYMLGAMYKKRNDTI
jgi:hypothetical protein